MRGRPLPSIETVAIAGLAAAAIAVALVSESYTHFILALVALTAVVGVGLNVLLGLSGQVSLGHVGFYAIGAYVSAILMTKGVSFWLALPLAGILAGLIGALLAMPALRVAGPYLAMITIAFAFIVQHGTIEWKSLTGGQNGLMSFAPPTLFGRPFAERENAILAVLLAAASLYMYRWLAASAWGRAMIAVRDSETAARSIGLNPVTIKTASFAISALLAGLAGAVYSPLMMFVAPDSFPFSQSILFLLAVIVGGAGSLFGPVVGAAITVLLPELLSQLAEYRLLFVGALLLTVLWLAPEGVIGLFARLLPKWPAKAEAEPPPADLEKFLAGAVSSDDLTVTGIGIAFGGVKAATDVSFAAPPRRITSLIGPNGAGKSTVLNLVGGFYRPDTGSVRRGSVELAGAPAWRVARNGIARTYQTTQLFGAMTVLDNILIALRRGRLGNPVVALAGRDDERLARALLAFVGYHGRTDVEARHLAHVDLRLVEIARALATRPAVLLLDEPAAGLMRSDKDDLGRLLKKIASSGVAVILVEHDMQLVMDISDHIVVLDAGVVIASGDPASVRNDPLVLKAYLGARDMQPRQRQAERHAPSGEIVLSCLKLTAGYGGVPVLQELSLEVRAGEMVALLGANGAGKSTTMLAMSGLLRPVNGSIILDDARIDALPAYLIAARGLALVPEGRQLFSELSVIDNILLGAHTRSDPGLRSEAEAILKRFPRLRDRINSRAGLLSGGEQQMVAIARGLMAKPRILLLDEPSLGLAPAMIDELFAVLADLRDEGVTILLVDQMAALALKVADRGYVLETGRIVHGDSAEALAHDPALEAAYLGRKEAVN
ncbi:branched-chain amino acid ABC transporter ATP-binding protein/permease [Bradyrhizobium sp. NP1]|uniref:branched-chain amino acid ABC transporter ATP-binding protein/permease n=1 Tax=Bradyrhizobium sp. NP1 TaxID=3049772 RepID=UPI0025A525A1|nr:branched-chain amino acid ABC transporter ATP-binding protein/permease [Bradyrhizobium sp. NP1]WJR82042.1 branched-chain amino acid ABC transporter ATP-binding protein/permease [Bradyrhizobium sp. NP1]